jgi:predicted nucleotidyltransferase
MREITAEELNGYVEGFKARAASEAARRRELQARAGGVVSRWVERLRVIPEVRRVVLYGSLAKGTFDKGSDIDLVVEGLPRELHFRIWSELEDGESFRLDLHRWEELAEGFRQLVQSYGKLLYAQP